MFDEFRYGAGASGGPRKQGWSTAQSPRVSQRADGDRLVESAGEGRVFVLGGNGSTLAATSSFRPANRGEKAGSIITTRLIPLAWTPLGVTVGTSRQDVGIPLAGIVDWIDRTFPAEDEHAFVASLRDVELLARIGWEAAFPEPIEERSVLNRDDLPEEVAEGLTRPPQEVVACASCRQLCVRDEFVWKEKQLCAWDYHAQVFGKRGPWHQGAYEERHFETVPACAYVAPPLLGELGVEEVFASGAAAANVIHALVNTLIAGDPARAHMAVRTESGFSLLREV